MPFSVAATSPLAGYPADVMYEQRAGSGGTVTWASVAGGPVTDVVMFDSIGVRSATTISWTRVDNQWINTGYRTRVRDDEGGIFEVSETFSPTGEVTSVSQSPLAVFASSCVDGVGSALLSVGRLVAPRPLYAQSSADCWKFKRIGTSEIFSWPAEGFSQCTNYALNEAIDGMVPDEAGIASLVAAGGAGLTKMLQGSAAPLSSTIALWGAGAYAAVLPSPSLYQLRGIVGAFWGAN